MSRDAHLYPLRQPHPAPRDNTLWNWAQNAQLGKRQQVKRPTTEAELQDIVRQSTGQIRVTGSKLSSGKLLQVGADDVLLDLSAFCGLITSDTTSVTFGAATPLYQVYATLRSMNRMTGASPGVIAVQTLAGAMATGTHGQGLQQSSLADEALRIRMVLADGTLREWRREEKEFGAMQLSLGSLGIVTAITLRTEPLRIFTCHKSAVSAETLEQDLLRWNQHYPFSKAWWFIGDNLLHLWNAQQASEEQRQHYLQQDGEAITHPMQGNRQLDDSIDQTLAHMRHDTQIQGKGGKQFRTVTRFRNVNAVTGDIYQLFCRGIAVPQINVEIGVPLENTPAIIRKIKKWYADQQPHLHYPIILRCTGASAAWLSPAYGRPTCFFGFVVYYADDGSLSAEALHFLTEVEKLLAAEGGRPHWGKYYDDQRYAWRDIYPEWDTFRALRRQLDPQCRFSNDYINTLFD